MTTAGTWTEPPRALPDGFVPPSASLNPPAAPVEDVPELGTPPRDVRFMVNGEVFACPSDLPVLSLLQFAEMADQVNEQNVAALRQTLRDMFSIVLTDESAARFVERLESKDRPIGLEAMQRVIPYVLEKFGLRPTTPSDSSSTGPGSPSSGPSLTANAPTAGSMSAGSPLLGS